MNADTLIAWAGDLWTDFGFMPVVLVLLFLVSGWIRRVVENGRLGPITGEAPIPIGAAWSLAIIPVGLWLLSVYAACRWPEAFLVATREDGWIENVQVLLLALGTMLGVRVFWLLRKSSCRGWGWCYLFLALALFWTTGEEISWGQRLLHLPTPAWFEAHNAQQEMNLHNFSDVDDRLSNATDWALAGMILASAGLAMTGLRAVRRWHVALWMPPPWLIPSLGCVLSYGPLMGLYALAHPAGTVIPEAIEQLQEAREFILYGTVCLFLWAALRHARTLPDRVIHRPPD